MSLEHDCKDGSYKVYCIRNWTEHLKINVRDKGWISCLALNQMIMVDTFSCILFAIDNGGHSIKIVTRAFSRNLHARFSCTIYYWKYLFLADTVMYNTMTITLLYKCVLQTKWESSHMQWPYLLMKLIVFSYELA